MTEEVKKSTRKRTATKKTASAATKATAKKTSTARPRTPKKVPVNVRNLRRIAVHIRCDNPLREKPFKIVLKPRGLPGDMTVVPVEIQSSLEYIQALRDGLFEIVTEKEAAEIMDSYPNVGYTQPTPVQIIRERDNLIGAAPDWDSSPRNPANQQRRGRRQNPESVARNPRVGENVGPTYADVPGSDGGLHGRLRTAGGEESLGRPDVGGDRAMPSDVNFQRPGRISIERR